MHQEQAVLRALGERPGDSHLRLVFADWLEERGDPRGELLRLAHTLSQSVGVPNRPELEARLRTLVERGVQPIGPFWTNSLGMKFAWIPRGTFMMGSPDWTPHQVTLTGGFYMGIYPVTEEQWHEVVANHLYGCEGRSLPVAGVSWDDCQEFLRRLSETDKMPYRLPTEAEWEYACRAGTTTEYHFGDALSADQANHKGTNIAWKTPVGSYPANAFGLHDMHGNVWEWCQDWFTDWSLTKHPPSHVVDPQGPDSGIWHVMRGGSWLDRPELCCSAHRLPCSAGDRSDEYGFRVCFGVG